MARRLDSLSFYFGRFKKAMYDCFERLLMLILAAGPIPRHVAIIMDGNRRFAKLRGLESVSGHISGADSLSNAVEYLCKLGVEFITVYAFSVENFRRPKHEVDTLMKVFQQRLDSIANGELAGFNDVKLRVVGDLKLLPEEVLQAANRAMAATDSNERAVLNICVAYSSSNEIVNAVESTCKRSRFCRDMIVVNSIEENLYTAGCPEPDILIRTSGETRLSNFLLWQSGFCYLHATSVLWPEFSRPHMLYAILCYQRAAKSLKTLRQKYSP